MRMDVRVFLTLLLFGVVSSVKINNTPPEKVQPWMDLLKDFGNKELQKINQRNKNNFKKHNPDGKFSPINQYLVAAVLSTEEFNKKFVNRGQQINKLKGKRLKSFINQKRNEHGNRKYHGEMIFLHETGGLDDMVKLLRDEYGEETEPFVLLYSFYIPCAHVNDLGYSCSEEIGRVSDSLKYPMFVAFTEVFHRTDQNQSKTYMAAGHDVQVFKQDIKKSNYVDAGFTSAKNNQGQTFQQLFGECLLGMGIGTCNSEEDRQKFVTRFVNAAVYTCTENSANRGFLTEYSRTPFLTCINGFISKCSSCNTCSKSQAQTVTTVVEFCAGSIVQPSLYLGRADSLDDDKWPMWDGAWKELTRPLNPNGLQKLPCRVNDDALDNCVNQLTQKLQDLGNKAGSNHRQNQYNTRKRQNSSPQQKHLEALLKKMKF